jgi:hypothetical protein
MKTEEEVIIKQYYGEDFEKIIRSDYGIDDDGFSNFYDHGNETFLNGYEIFSGHSQRDIVKVRPLGLGQELKKLRTNNGWIKIESEDDLPEYGYYEVVKRDTGEHLRASLDNNISTASLIKYYSHYKPIEKIDLPLH